MNPWRERLRILASTPANERVVAVLVACLLGIAVSMVVLLLLFPASDHENARPEPIAPARSTHLPSPLPPPVLSEDDLADATRAARRFLRGYIEYSYGRLDAQHIPASSKAVRDALGAAPPRVPATVAHRHPYVVRITPQPDGTSTSVSFLALISDESTLRVTVTLGGNWRVTRIDPTA